jgi:hypothetical protein
MVNLFEEIERLKREKSEILEVLKELEESSTYWSEYDVPLGIVERIHSTIRKFSD